MIREVTSSAAAYIMPGSTTTSTSTLSSKAVSPPTTQALSSTAIHVTSGVATTVLSSLAPVSSTRVASSAGGYLSLAGPTTTPLSSKLVSPTATSSAGNYFVPGTMMTVISQTRSAPDTSSTTTTVAVPTSRPIQSQGTSYSQISQAQYVLVRFVPLLLALFFTFPWNILDITVRSMEPFYQLHEATDSESEDPLLLDYCTTTILTTPIKALYRGHFIVFLSSVISLLVLLLSPLASEVLFVSTSGVCSPDDPLSQCQGNLGQLSSNRANN